MKSAPIVLFRQLSVFDVGADAELGRLWRLVALNKVLIFRGEGLNGGIEVQDFRVDRVPSEMRLNLF